MYDVRGGFLVRQIGLGCRSFFARLARYICLVSSVIFWRLTHTLHIVRDGQHLAIILMSAKALRGWREKYWLVLLRLFSEKNAARTRCGPVRPPLPWPTSSPPNARVRVSVKVWSRVSLGRCARLNLTNEPSESFLPGRPAFVVRTQLVGKVTRH